MTSSRTLAMSTASPAPVITSSQIRSVSKPDHPALLLMPSGGVLLESECGLFTTAIWARVWEAMSSKRRRTSGFRAGFEEGESSISERVTLIAARCWGYVSNQQSRKENKHITYLYRTLFKNHTPSLKNMLVGACYCKIPPAATDFQV